VNPTWWESAREDFADIYVKLSVTRQRVLAATVERVEATLATTPLDVGEDRGWEGPGRMKRFWYVPPLGIWYVVSAAGVEITSVGERNPKLTG